MNRGEKTAEVELLHKGFLEARNAFLVGFAGLTVQQANDLRRKVRASSSSYRVVKNRLARRAAAGTLLEGVEAQFQGPTGVAYNTGDPVVLAKVLATFAKDNPALSLRAGVVEGTQVLVAAELEALAKLPGLQEIRAQLLCLIQTPATQLARIIGTPATQMAQVLSARQKKIEADGAAG